MHIVLLLALVFLPASASAQNSVTQGIGFAQADERVWLCRHEDPFEALSCAVEHCTELAPGEECLPTAWCYPGGWSGAITLYDPDFRSTRVLCGMDSEEALNAMLSAYCAADPEVTRCAKTVSVDPMGNEQQVEGVEFAGGATSAATEAGSPEAPAVPSEEAAPEADAGSDSAPASGPDQPNDEGGAPAEDSQ